jgi:hypothetical protein
MARITQSEYETLAAIRSPSQNWLLLSSAWICDGLRLLDIELEENPNIAGSHVYQTHN